jgi:hypothetical protein
VTGLGETTFPISLCADLTRQRKLHFPDGFTKRDQDEMV